MQIAGCPYKLTIDVNAQLDAKADSSAVTSIDTKATNASIAAGNAATDVNNLTLTINDPTNGLASKTNSADVNTIISTQMASGGSIYNSIDSIAAQAIISAITPTNNEMLKSLDDKALASDGIIYSALSSPDGLLSKAIAENIAAKGNISGSIDNVIGEAVSSEGTIGKAIAVVDTKVNAKDIEFTEALKNKAESSQLTIVDTKATNAATDVNNLTLTINDPTNGLASKVTNDDVSSIIATQITSGGSIFEAIGSAAAEGGTIAESIKNQVESESGPVADAIKKGSDDAITTAVATGGAIATTIDTKLADATNTGVIKTALDTKASSTDLDTLANTNHNSYIGISVILL